MPLINLVQANEDDWERRASDGWPIFNKHYDRDEFLPNSPADDFIRDHNEFENNNEKYYILDEKK